MVKKNVHSAVFECQFSVIEEEKNQKIFMEVESDKWITQTFLSNSNS